jgi:hypothetical protein
MCVAVKKFQQMMLSFFRNGSAHQLQSIPTLHKNFFTASPVSFFWRSVSLVNYTRPEAPPIPLREVLRALRASAFRFCKDERFEDRRSKIGNGGFFGCSIQGAGRSMDGLEQDAPATRKKRLLRSTIHDPSSSSRPFAFIRG